MAKVDKAVRELIYYHGKRAAGEVLGELPEKVKDMRRELRDLRKTVDTLREQVDVLMEHRRQQMDVPPAPEEKAENSRVTKRTLKSIRKNFELDQEQLAYLLDVSPGTISQWERGETKPRSNNKARIVTLREMDKSQVDDILGRENDGPKWQGDSLKALREKMDLTQAEMADLLDVSPNTVSGWEAGRTTPSGGNIKRIEELADNSDAVAPQAAGEKQFDGSRLRKWRENMGLGRAEVADELGVSYASVQNWESGNTTPRGQNRRKVQELMQKSTEELEELGAEGSSGGFDAERLTALKRELNISQGQLAELLDVSSATVWSWETGRTTPSSRNIEEVEKLEQASAEEVHEKLE